MSSFLGSHQAVVLATAMAVSGTVILFAFRRQKAFPGENQLFIRRNSASCPDNLRPCISSDKRQGEKLKKKKKRVHFAEDVVEPTGDNVEFRKKHTLAMEFRPVGLPEKLAEHRKPVTYRGVGKMPANRAALYHGILQDRSQRMACAH